MTMPEHPLSLFAFAMLFAAVAAAADRSDSTYTADNRDPSVREAQAARQEARRGRLQSEEDSAVLERNRRARCEYLPVQDREYCLRRMNGEGTVSGSVEGGGVLRELRVTVPAQ